MATWSYNGNDTAEDSAGNVLAGRIFTIWTAETSGTQLTSTIRTWAGATVTAGQVTSESDGRIRFKETSGTYPVLWMKAPDNSMYPIAALEAIGAALGGVSLSAANTWTAAQNLSAGASVPDNTWSIADTAGLTAALAAAANPVYRGVVADQMAMLALSANLGDSCKRTDTSSFWFLWSGSDPTVLGNWVEVSGGGTFTPTIAADYAGAVVYQSGAHGAARITSRTDVLVIWNTTDGQAPTNKITGDVWLNEVGARESRYNSGTSAYEPLRDSSPLQWKYIQPVAGGPLPNDSNGGLGRKDMDVLDVKPS